MRRERAEQIERKDQHRWHRQEEPSSRSDGGLARAQLSPRSEGVLQLQRLAGNRATVQLLCHQLTLQRNGDGKKRKRTADPPPASTATPVHTYGLRDRSKRRASGVDRPGDQTNRAVPDSFTLGTALSIGLLANIFRGDNTLAGKVAVYRTRSNRTMLWWVRPLRQVDNFVYTGDRQDDIDDLDATVGSRRGYTWHHTGYPLNDRSAGTMQLVPTEEHRAIAHVGAIWADSHTG